LAATDRRSTSARPPSRARQCSSKAAPSASPTCWAGRIGGRAGELLASLNIPERLWHLPPATFSGGEQQRVNIARGFAAEHPILLLDEPTASLDAANREAVVAFIEARKRAGAALLGIFHDDDVRLRVADRVIDVSRFAAWAGAPWGTALSSRTPRWCWPMR
jgi:alpha-D-ribose 1-methylphosphonate 5-triphosphate synthase subunit PhnL